MNQERNSERKIALNSYWFDQLIERLGVDNSTVGKWMGKDDSTVSRYRQGKTPTVPLISIEQFVAEHNVRVTFENRTLLADLIDGGKTIAADYVSVGGARTYAHYDLDGVHGTVIDSFFDEVEDDEIIRVMQTWIPPDAQDNWQENKKGIADRIASWARRICSSKKNPKHVELRVLLMANSKLLAERVRHRDDRISIIQAQELIDFSEEKLLAMPTICKFVKVDVRFFHGYMHGPLYIFGNRKVAYGFFGHRCTSNKSPLLVPSAKDHITKNHFTANFDRDFDQVQTNRVNDLVSSLPDWRMPPALKLRTIPTTLMKQINVRKLLSKHIDELNQLSSSIAKSAENGGRTFIVSIGKAAYSMLNALYDCCELGEDVEGIVSSPSSFTGIKRKGFQYYKSGHPEPNEQSMNAGLSAIEMLRKTSAEDVVVFLVSGGGSAAIETIPPKSNVTAGLLEYTHNKLCRVIQDISEINVVRSALSTIKGGGLARLASPSIQHSILLSDVRENDIVSIASGPSIYCDVNSPNRLVEIMEHYSLEEQLPRPVIEVLKRKKHPLTKESQVFSNSSWTCIGSNHDALVAAKDLAEQFGWKAIVDTSFDELSAEKSVSCLLQRLEDSSCHRPVCLISGGEVASIRLGNGKGGRNLSFVQHAVKRIAGQQMAVMSLATDGNDAGTESMGAIATGTTFSRGQAIGLNLEQSIQISDSFNYFNSLGDVIFSDETHNNLRDVRMLLRW